VVPKLGGVRVVRGCKISLNPTRVALQNTMGNIYDYTNLQVLPVHLIHYIMLLIFLHQWDGYCANMRSKLLNYHVRKGEMESKILNVFL